MGSSAVSITPAVYTIIRTPNENQILQPSLASAAVVQVFTNPINYTLDGTTPDASTGFNAAAGDYIYLDCHQEVKDFQAIRSGGADAAIEVLPLWGA